MMTLLDFVQSKLSEPGVVLTDVASATGISLRSLQSFKHGASENAGTGRIERLAQHFGYRFEAVPISTRRPVPERA